MIAILISVEIRKIGDLIVEVVLLSIISGLTEIEETTVGVLFKS